MTVKEKPDQDTDEDGHNEYIRNLATLAKEQQNIIDFTELRNSQLFNKIQGNIEKSSKQAMTYEKFKVKVS